LFPNQKKNRGEIGQPKTKKGKGYTKNKKRNEKNTRERAETPAQMTDTGLTTNQAPKCVKWL